MGSDSAIMAEAPCCFAAQNAPSSSCAPPSSNTTRSMPSWLEAVRVSPTCKSNATFAEWRINATFRAEGNKSLSKVALIRHFANVALDLQFREKPTASSQLGLYL